MTTPLTFTSMDQGKIYKDWTLETVDDTPSPARRFLAKWLAALRLRFGKQETGVARAFTLHAIQR
jgi:hypothetical protein